MFKEEIIKVIDQTVDNTMYSFPDTYTTLEVLAFQKGLDKLWSTLTANIKNYKKLTMLYIIKYCW